MTGQSPFSRGGIEMNCAEVEEGVIPYGGETTLATMN
jgi:hypothetical protein